MYPKGHVNYWIDGQMFENSKGKRDGREKAERYCLDNMLDTNNIIKFDSRTETQRYNYLLDLQSKGVIAHLSHHFIFKIRDEETNACGDVFPVKTYCADFVYQVVETGQRVVEDVKGTEFFITSEFLDTKRDFDMTFKAKGLYISIVLYRSGQWVEWHIGDKKKSQKLLEKQREEIHVLKQAQHARMIEDNKRAREQATYMRLRDMINSGVKLTSAQKKRFNELFPKFNA